MASGRELDADGWFTLASGKGAPQLIGLHPSPPILVALEVLKRALGIKGGLEARARVSEALFRDQGVPSRVAWIPVVGVSSQLPVQVRVLHHLLPVEADTEPWSVRDLYAPFAVLKMHATKAPVP